MLRPGDAKVFKKILADEVADEARALQKINRKTNEGLLGLGTERTN